MPLPLLAIRQALTRFAMAALAALFAWTVWPTPYRYDHMQMLGETAPGAVFPVRTDRLTGRSEILLPEMLNDSRHHMKLEWVGAIGEPLPADALAQLQTGVLIDVDPLPYAQILNTTTYRITKLRWEVRGTAAGGGRGQAVLGHLDQSVFIEPNSVARLYLELGRFGQGASIVLGSAWGTVTSRDGQ